MQLNMALYEDSRTQQLDILYRHFATLPIGDAVIAAVRTKNISFAQTLAFQGLENNRYDSTLYKENLNLVETYADVVDFKATRLKRSNIDQDTLHINNLFHQVTHKRVGNDLQLSYLPLICKDYQI